ncbi:MAG: DUF721 domain-containing protein [Bacteroidales bacterium]|nr:DUF721 domain-containing protein [Bacteroidales bacterium]
MRRTNTEEISGLMQRYIKAYRLEQPLGRARIINNWSEIVGAMIANNTDELNIVNRKLYVKLKSSIVRHELMMIKTPLIERLNEVAGVKVIDDIIFQ